MADHDRLLPDGRLQEIAPEYCPTGHPWGPFKVLVGWKPCLCRPPATGHRTYSCRSCDAVVCRPPCTATGRTAADLALVPPG